MSATLRLMPSSGWLPPLVGGLLFFGFWQLQTIGRSVLLLPSPGQVLGSIGTLLQQGTLQAAWLNSLQLLLMGFGLSTVVGISLGLLLGRFYRLGIALDWIVTALYVVPTSAILPIIVMWLGIGFEAKVLVVFLSGVFEVITFTWAGVRNAGQTYIEVARSFCVNDRQMFMKVLLPGAAPYIVAGLRLGIGHSLVGLILAEFFLAVTRITDGVGALMVFTQARIQTQFTFAALVTLALFAVLLNAGLIRLERRLLPWQRGLGGEQ